MVSIELDRSQITFSFEEPVLIGRVGDSQPEVIIGLIRR